jgi:hypothetical protein
MSRILSTKVWPSYSQKQLIAGTVHHDQPPLSRVVVQLQGHPVQALLSSAGDERHPYTANVPIT